MKGRSCCNDVEIGVVDVNEVAWRMAVCSSVVWFTSRSGICAKVSVTLVVCTTGDVMLPRIIVA